MAHRARGVEQQHQPRRLAPARAGRPAATGSPPMGEAAADGAAEVGLRAAARDAVAPAAGGRGSGAPAARPAPRLGPARRDRRCGAGRCGAAPPAALAPARRLAGAGGVAGVRLGAAGERAGRAAQMTCHRGGRRGRVMPDRPPARCARPRASHQASNSSSKRCHPPAGWQQRAAATRRSSAGSVRPAGAADRARPRLARPSAKPLPRRGRGSRSCALSIGSGSAALAGRRAVTSRGSRLVLASVLSRQSRRLLESSPDRRAGRGRPRPTRAAAQSRVSATPGFFFRSSRADRLDEARDLAGQRRLDPRQRARQDRGSLASSG